MSEAIEGAFERIRGQIFGGSAVLQEVVEDRGERVTAEAITAATHRIKAWQAVRSRLEPAQVREAIERREPWALRYGEYLEVLRRIARLERLPPRVDDVEDAIEYLWRLVSRLGRLPPLRYNPARSRPRKQPWWDRDGLFAGFEERGLRLPDDLLNALMGILGDLVGDFLKQLEEVGKFELPPILPAPVQVDMRIAGRADPGAGPPGVVPPGFEVADVGGTEIVVASVGAGTTVTVGGPVRSGPVVVEHISLASDDVFLGSVQLNVQGSGVVLGGGAAAAAVFGEPLFVSASNAALGGSSLDWGAFAGFAEFWPRRLVKMGSYRLILTVTNEGAAARRLTAAVDGRALRRVS